MMVHTHRTPLFRRKRPGSKELFRSHHLLPSIPENDMKDFSDEESSIQSSPTSVRATSSVSSSTKVFSDCTESLGLVNRERIKRALRPFRSSPTLDRLATEQAMAMARSGSVFHSVNTIDELMLLLSSATVAENIQRGDSVLHMHQDTMHHTNTINRSNILSTHFTQFGAAVEMGRDGKIYSCQLFRA